MSKKWSWLATALVGLGGASAWPALAGTVITGGGLLYEAQANPWFLENTTTVSYCIEADAQAMHLAPAQMEAQVHSALGAWQAAFKAVASRNWPDVHLKPYGMVRLATQTFIQEPCGPATQLHFSLGTLSDELRAYVHNPRQYVATTVRTAYDEENLRGKGFIYVAPASGPLRPSANTFAEDPWGVCDGCLLGRVLSHELGHVFGLTHSGGAANDLMSARNPEIMTQRRTVDIFHRSTLPKQVLQQLTSVDIFAFPPANTKRECDGYAQHTLSSFFNIPRDWTCVELRVDNSGTVPKFAVYAAATTDMPLQLMGEARATGAVSTYTFSDPGIVVKLSRKQHVFTALPENVDPEGYLDGPQAYESVQQSASFISADGRYSTPLLLRLMPNTRLQIIGSIDGVITEVVNN